MSICRERSKKISNFVLPSGLAVLRIILILRLAAADKNMGVKTPAETFIALCLCRIIWSG